MIPARAGSQPPIPSMKVPPKRKGNADGTGQSRESPSLNESPSEKEGK